MRIHTKEDFVNFIIDQKLNVKQVNELLKTCGFTVWFLDEDYTSEQIAEEVYKWLQIPNGTERPIFLPFDMEFDIKQHHHTIIEFKQ
jgi:hypothetical protein